MNRLIGESRSGLVVMEEHPDAVDAQPLGPAQFTVDGG